MYCRAHHVCVLVALTCLSATPGMLSAKTLEVQPDGKTGFATIQAAIDAAVDGDIVVIHPGTYTGRGNRDIQLERKAIGIRGTDPSDPSVVEATIIDCQGTVDEPHRAFRISDFAGQISGLTMTGGLASAGGAVYCDNSNLVLAHCRIVNNATLPGAVKTEPEGGPGGGVYGLASIIEIIDCLISGNATGAGAGSKETTAGHGGDGGGLCTIESVVYVTDSTIADNVAGDGGNSDFFAGRGGNGGGLCCDSLVLTRTSVLRNVSGRGGSGPNGRPGGNGAGVYCKRATIDRCIIEANTSGAGGDSTDEGKAAGGPGGDGAGVFCAESIEMFDTLVAGNRTGRGGNTFDAATAGDDGSGAGLWCSLGLIDHCTVVSNAIAVQKPLAAGSTQGGGIFCAADTVIASSILWGNTPDQIAGQNCDNVVYCDVEGGTCPASPGNLATDPLFVAPGNWVDPADATVIVAPSEPDAVWTTGDYRLAEASPCVDAGDPDGARDASRTDLQGTPRFAGQAADMGAYEGEGQSRQGLVPVYRFVSPKTGKYFYTQSETEKDKLRTQFAHAWDFEGIAYYVYLDPIASGLMPVYRFWSGALSSHLYTISEAERDKLIENYPDVWMYEGPAFYAYPPGQQPSGAKPVHRFWSGRLGGHFFTIDEDERQRFVDNFSHIWLYEQIAWYAYDTPGAGEGPGTPDTPDTPAGPAVYEFAGGRDSASCQLELKAYLDGEDAQLDATTVSLTPAAGRMQMTVDLDGLSAQLTGLDLASELLQHDGTAADATGKLSLSFSMYLYGFFDTATARGPYTIDAKTLSFPTAPAPGGITAGETLSIAGSVVVEGTKFDVDLALSPTEFALDGTATFDNSDDSGRLDILMDGPFQWTRSRQEDLLLEADVRGHVLKIYLTEARVRTMGLWQGKRVPGAKDAGK